MRISDWSSDVCSADLRFVKGAQGRARHHARLVRIAHHLMDRARDLAVIPLILSRPRHFQSPPAVLTLPAGPVPRRPIPVPRTPLQATMPNPPSICSPEIGTDHV